MYRKICEDNRDPYLFPGIVFVPTNNHRVIFGYSPSQWKRFGVVLAGVPIWLDKRDDLNIFRYDKMADAISLCK
jgi:hypothetical protein